MSGNEKDNNDDYKPPGVDMTVDVDVLPAGVEPASISGNQEVGNDNWVQKSLMIYMMVLIRMLNLLVLPRSKPFTRKTTNCQMFIIWLGNSTKKMECIRSMMLRFSQF